MSRRGDPAAAPISSHQWKLGDLDEFVPVVDRLQEHLLRLLRRVDEGIAAEVVEELLGFLGDATSTNHLLI